MTQAIAALFLALAPVALPQTPLCQWNGASLECPASAPAFVPTAPDTVDQLDRLQQLREQRSAELQAQAAIDRAVAAARFEQAQRGDANRAAAQARVTADWCRENELSRRRLPSEPGPVCPNSR